MRSLPPGTILQRLYFQGRLRRLPQAEFFYDVGAGRGDLSNLLLERGLSGEGFDLNPEACRQNLAGNHAFVASRRYRVSCRDFTAQKPERAADIIVCAMVLEHWPEAEVQNFLQLARSLLTPSGRLCLFVPGSPAHWGIEDETAGHLRRYTFATLRAAAERAGLRVEDLTGLTYPLSNLLLPISNFLVRRAESHKTKLSAREQTISSGARNVGFKTVFPDWVRCLVNEATLAPFHWWQRLAARNPASLVLYCELSRN